MAAQAERPVRMLRPEPLTADAFAPFGDVIEASPAAETISVNNGFATRFHDLAAVDASADGGRPGVSVFRAKPLPAPIEIAMMERHPLSSQAFIPLERRAYLVVVAPPGDLDPDAVRAFHARGDQGVSYAAGVWHHFLLALEQESEFLVIDRIGPGENCDEVALPAAQRWTIAP